MRTFDTVRVSGKHAGLGSQGSLNSLGYGGSVHSTPTHHPHTPSHVAATHMTNSGSGYAMSYLSSRGSSLYSGGSGHPSLDSGADSDASMHTDSEDNYPLVYVVHPLLGRVKCNVFQHLCSVLISACISLCMGCSVTIAKTDALQSFIYFSSMA